jgi:hypothetical protein
MIGVRGAVILLCIVPSVVAAAGPGWAAAPPVHRPDLLFDISDEDLDEPLGVVIDAFVADGVVYLLDQQSCNVRRITMAGRELPALGRKGEGPGDLAHPERLAVFADGRCIVLQTFSARAPCLEGDGDACGVWNVSQLREGRASTIWMRADVDPRGNLLVAAVSTLRAPSRPDAGFDELGVAASVWRIRPGGETDVLFTTDGTAADDEAVIIPPELYAFVVHGWDINDAGTMLHASPDGRYAVTIGHAGSGTPRVLQLAMQPGDDERARKLVATAPSRTTVAHIAGVYWLDDDHFMVRPAAEVRPAPVADLVGTFEVFRADGRSLGRHELICDHDPANDLVFVRKGTVIVVAGGKSIARATYRDVSGFPPSGSPPSDPGEVRVRAYELFRKVRGGTAR